jgi:DNA-binding NtrC family response regulator
VSSPNNLIGKATSLPIPISPQARRRLRSDRAAEKRFLEAELAATGENVSKLARKLGIARSTLRYRIDLHNISRRIPPD